MGMIKLTENVPQVYVKESRDFQLFLRLYTYLFASVKENTDSLLTTSDSRKIKNNFLPLLSEKVGLFIKDGSIKDDQLRELIRIFPYIKKYKGSLKAVNYLINTLLKLFNVTADYVAYRITEDGWVNGLFLTKDTILITVFGQVEFNTLVNLLSDYLLPPGFNLYIQSGQKFKFDDDSMQFYDNINLIQASDNYNIQLQNYFINYQLRADSDSYADIPNKYVGSISHMYLTPAKT